MTLIAGHPTAFWIGIVFEMTSMRNLTVHRGLPSWITSGSPTNWTPFPEGRIRRLLKGPGATLMLGAGFLALRVQVDAAEEFGK